MLADGNKALSSGEESAAAAVATKVCIFNIKKIKGCDDSLSHYSIVIFQIGRTPGRVHNITDLKGGDI